MTNTSLTLGQSCLICRPGVEAVQERHRDVEDDDVRLQPLRFGDQRPPVGYGADDLAFSRQQLLECAEKQVVIVGQQYTGTGHVVIGGLERAPCAAAAMVLAAGPRRWHTIARDSVRDYADSACGSTPADPSVIYDLSILPLPPVGTGSAPG